MWYLKKLLTRTVPIRRDVDSSLKISESITLRSPQTHTLTSPDEPKSSQRKSSNRVYNYEDEPPIQRLGRFFSNEFDSLGAEVHEPFISLIYLER